jgi:hypothetical protein
MSSCQWWEDREDKTLMGRQIISISRDLLSSLSSLSSLGFTYIIGKIFSPSICRKKIFSSWLPSVLREDREDREDKQPLDRVFLPNRWEDRFRALNHINTALHIVYSCLPSVFPPQENSRLLLGSGQI